MLLCAGLTNYFADSMVGCARLMQILSLVIGPGLQERSPFGPGTGYNL